MPAGGYVIPDERAGTNSATHFYVNTSISWLNNQDGAAALFNASGSGADFVRWGNDVTPAPTGTHWYGSNPPRIPNNPVLSLGCQLNGVDTDYGND